MKSKLKKLSTILLIFSLTIATLSPLSSASAKTDKSIDDYKDLAGSYSIDPSIPSYKEFKEQNTYAYASSQVVVDASNYSRYAIRENGEEKTVTPEILTDYNGSEGKSILTTENSLIEFDIEVPETGLYNLEVLYYPYTGKNSEIQRSMFIDGEFQYSEMALLEFYRVWKSTVLDTKIDENGIEVIDFGQDNQGNQLKPSMTEAPEWVTTFVYDSNGYEVNPLAFYLTKGKHTISFLSIKEPMLIKELKFVKAETAPSYKEALALWKKAGAKEIKDTVVRVEAENAVKTSSQMLYPTQDQSSPAVYPSSASKLLNNSIGGNSWRLIGQWIEWDIEVPESGLYNLSFYAKQSFVRGIYVSRKITIDGEVPFAELGDYGFVYSQNWRLDTLSDEDGNPYKIYLEKGKHTLRMEAVLGDFSEIIGEVRTAVSELNAIYRKVIRITGTSPDAYRDYGIEKKIPELKDELISAKTKIDNAISNLRAAAGSGSDKETVLLTMSDDLEELIEDGERFGKILSNFKTDVRACGNWLTTAVEQPLRLDTIYLTGCDQKITIKNSNWFARVWHELKKMVCSFFVDYNQIGNVSDGEDTITLWIGSGRDQANVIKSLIDKTFTNKTGIGVNVMLVDMSTLLQATLAGQGPDVAIQVAYDNPLNYGLRNAVADLTQFDDLEEVLTRFKSSAYEAFGYNGAMYGLPETQTYPMMFYRKDILAELGVELPETWDDVKVLMSVFSKNRMEFGMLPGENIFAMLLYQAGGTYYCKDGAESALGTEVAVNAFKEYCEYYSDYKLDAATSLEERFKTGECPIIIADYTLYNTLQVSAPDIQGLWGIAPVPGTVREDGTVNNTVASAGSACVIMDACENKDAAWEFLKWWTDASTQIAYGSEMESLMGASARVATANMEAFEKMAWPVDDYEALCKQFNNVIGIPQVPGGYYTFRNVNNAYYSVVADFGVATPREELMDAITYINAEIDFKRKEFGFNVVEH